MNMKEHGRVFLGLTLMVSLIAIGTAQSSAEIFVMSYNTATTTYADGVEHFLPINGAATHLNFTTTVPNQHVAVLFNGGCSVKGTEKATYVELEILIDGRVAPPSHNDRFCSDHGDDVLTHMARASTNVMFFIPQAGSHQLRVKARLANFNPGDRFAIVNTSTIVMR